MSAARTATPADDRRAFTTTDADRIEAVIAEVAISDSQRPRCPHVSKRRERCERPMQIKRFGPFFSWTCEAAEHPHRSIDQVKLRAFARSVSSS